MSDISQGSLTAEQVAEYTDALTRHHGEPVRPVSHYCEAFTAWSRAIGAKVRRIENGEESDSEAGYYKAISDALFTLTIPIYKSNLLARLIYGGEKLRTKPCPEHKGRWSGCEYGPIPCGCGAGMNVTGWLAESPEAEHNHVGGPIPVVVAPDERSAA